MVITRRWAVFLVLVGVWTWLIWPRFGLAIWRDERSFDGGSPTAFLWIHALLIGASLAIGTTVGVLGIRAWRARTSAGTGAGASGGVNAGASGGTSAGTSGGASAGTRTERSVAGPGSAPKD